MPVLIRLGLHRRPLPDTLQLALCTTILAKRPKSAGISGLLPTSYTLQLLIAELLGLTCLVLHPICFTYIKP